MFGEVLCTENDGSYRIHPVSRFRGLKINGISGGKFVSVSVSEEFRLFNVNETEQLLPEGLENIERGVMVGDYGIFLSPSGEILAIGEGFDKLKKFATCYFFIFIDL